MSIILPSIPLGSQTNFTLQGNTVDLRPQFGGPIQRYSRVGSRWSVSVTTRQMYYSQAATYLGLLEQGIDSIVLLPIPQQLNVGTPGTPVVSGTGQTGSNLVVSGFNAGYTIQAGSFINIVSGGNYYLHRVKQAVTANGSGVATLPINPMLKVSPNSGDSVLLTQPYIQGFLSQPSQTSTMNLTPTVSINFTVIENN